MAADTFHMDKKKLSLSEPVFDEGTNKTEKLPDYPTFMGFDLAYTSHSKPTKLKADPRPVRTKFSRHARRKAAKQDREFVQAVRRVIEVTGATEALNKAELRFWGYELYELKKITKKQARLLGAKVK